MSFFTRLFFFIFINYQQPLEKLLTSYLYSDIQTVIVELNIWQVKPYIIVYIYETATQFSKFSCSYLIFPKYYLKLRKVIDIPAYRRYLPNYFKNDSKKILNIRFKHFFLYL